MSESFAATVARMEKNLECVIRGKHESVRLVLISMLAGGHTLLEDVPGTGKTTLAKSLARSVDGVFRRIQFTPDLLPADITGSTFYSPKDGSFTFREGPVFSNVLLADEINRTSPRTQSALLEVMSEKQVTIEGKRKELPEPFFVIATQNPSDFHGTYPLPEAQLDRFTACVSLGYPDFAHEVEILYSQNEHHPLDDLKPVVSCREVLDLQAQVKTVRFDRAVAEYVVKLVDVTRADGRLRLGISPRGSLALYRTSQARARMDGRDHVTPEDVRELAVPVLAHRLLLDTKAKYTGVSPADIVKEALTKTPVPR
ncbi:MAG: MoxR family ATPase [Planctomycetes bacterium]|nr:MoxR family ATPase [Planctomycetota bacterium]